MRGQRGSARKVAGTPSCPPCVDGVRLDGVVAAVFEGVVVVLELPAVAVVGVFAVAVVAAVDPDAMDEVEGEGLPLQPVATRTLAATAEATASERARLVDVIGGLRERTMPTPAAPA